MELYSDLKLYLKGLNAKFLASFSFLQISSFINAERLILFNNQSRMLIQNNSFLLQRGLNRSIAVRNNIKVKSSKLPVDFFDTSTLARYSPRKRSAKKSIAEQHTRETYTPSFQRSQELIPVLSKGSERKIGTARVNVNMNRDDDLIKDVIDTTRSIRRVFRRKSLQLVRQSYQREDMELQLPKIENPRKGSRFF